MQQLRGNAADSRLAIVAGCTNGKALAAAPELRFSSIATSQGRLATWRSRLEAAPTKRPLRTLYRGQQWASTLDLERRAAQLGHRVDLWIVSAGLGLVPAHGKAPGYAASFSAGPDVVGLGLDQRRAWWQGLTAVSSSFAEVSATYEQVLVVLSPTYLEVVQPQLASLRGATLAVVSSRTSGDLYCSQGLGPALAASAMTLNAKAAAKLLLLAGGDPLGGEAVWARWCDWATSNQQSARVPREKATDDVVRHFIVSRLNEGSPCSRTSLLQQLRDTGTACQQSRFASIYAEVIEALT